MFTACGSYYLPNNIIKNKKIGFCFLIKDELFNQDVWNLFFKNISFDKYKIFIHYKTKCEVNLNNYKFIDNIDTKWGDISLVKASLMLFDEAFKNDCDLAILLSGDTLPLKPFCDFFKIKNTTFSKILIYDNESLKDKDYSEYNLIKKIKSNINKKYHSLDIELKNKMDITDWKKQNMFFCIKKEDYNVINSKNYLNYFNDVKIPDEFYFINIFTLNNLYFDEIDYIFCNTNPNKTQALNIDNDIFEQYYDIIENHYIIRKIEDYKKIPMYKKILEKINNN